MWKLQPIGPAPMNMLTFTLSSSSPKYLPQICSPVCFYGISQLGKLNPDFDKIEILRHFPFSSLWRIIRMPGIAWSTSWGAQKFSLSWRSLSHHALKDFVSPVIATHKYQDYLTSLIWPSNLGCTSQYSLIAKCMTASNVSDLDLHSLLTKTDLNFH